MEILQQIGVNQTSIIQFIIFSVVLFILTQLVFKPYHQAVLARHDKTRGGEELAVELQKQHVDMSKDYELKAKGLHSQIKEIYDLKKKSAAVEAESLLQRAREEAQQQLSSARHELDQAVLQAKAELDSYASSVASVIVEKLSEK